MFEQPNKITNAHNWAILNAFAFCKEIQKILHSLPPTILLEYIHKQNEVRILRKAGEKTGRM